MGGHQQQVCGVSRPGATAGAKALGQVRLPPGQARLKGCRRWEQPASGEGQIIVSWGRGARGTLCVPSLGEVQPRVRFPLLWSLGARAGRGSLGCLHLASGWQGMSLPSPFAFDVSQKAEKWYFLLPFRASRRGTPACAPTPALGGGSCAQQDLLHVWNAQGVPPPHQPAPCPTRSWGKVATRHPRHPPRMRPGGTGECSRAGRGRVLRVPAGDVPGSLDPGAAQDSGRARAGQGASSSRAAVAGPDEAEAAAGVPAPPRPRPAPEPPGTRGRGRAARPQLPAAPRSCSLLAG